MKKKKVVFEWYYTGYMAFCPYCGEPAYEKKACVFCGKEYKYEECDIDPAEGKQVPIKLTIMQMITRKKEQQK